ncbi:chromosome segregation ATPase [Clostridium acetobutylicum]|nr:chromosome segregation ATPase [Clostridium acetobutylicum]
MADLKLSIDENVKDKEKISLELKVATESLDEFDAKYSSNKTKYYESKSEHQKILSEIELLKEKTSNSDVAKNKLYKEIEDLDNSIVNLKSRYEIQLKTLTEDKNYNKELLSKINKSEEKKKNIDGLIEEWEKSIKQYKNDAIDIISTISQNNNEVVILKKEIESNESKLESIKRAGEGYSKSLKINEVTKNTLSEELVKINDKISGYENQIRENRSKISKLNRIISDEEKLNRELNSKSNKLEANKNMLINLEKQYEGYNRSVKNLMQHVTKGFVDVKPESSFVLGEVIKVKKEFETAVEISLGAAISDIITLDDNIAKKTYKLFKI